MLRPFGNAGLVKRAQPLCQTYRSFSKRHHYSKDEQAKRHPAKIKPAGRPNGKVAAMHGMELLFGISPIHAALAQGRRAIYGLYYQDQFMGDTRSIKFESVIKTAEALDIPLCPTSKRTLDSMVKSNNHQGLVLKAGQLEPPKLQKCGRFDKSTNTYSIVTHSSTVVLEPHRKLPLWLCLDRIQDQHNLGSIIRSALFFGVDAVILSGKEACSAGPLVSKVSTGAMECVNIYKTSRMCDVLDRSRSEGWAVVCATAAGSQPHRSTDLSGLKDLNSPTILVLGSEGDGIQHGILERSDLNVCIPTQADIPSYIDSLNVGVAAGIILSSINFK
ncbi:Ribose methyltransferase [Dipsacomyces acuminosporus]|nr:Ribose methyltransferase [Dipsacomyces acuminosporus]